MTKKGNGAIAYTVSVVDVEKNEYSSRLFVLPEGSAEPLYVMDASLLTGFFWEGEELFIYTQKDETSVMSLFDYGKNSLTELFKVDKIIEYAARATDGRWLFLCKDSLFEQKEGFIVAEQLPLRKDGYGYAGDTCQRGYIFDNAALIPAAFETIDACMPASDPPVGRDGAADASSDVVKPVPFEEGLKYPAILFIDEAPDHEIQLMANNGYGVVRFTPKESTAKSHEEIMEYLDETLSHCRWIDPDRLAVTGGSMANWVITHTDRFKAAVSDCCCVNEVSDYFLSDTGFATAEGVYGGTLWEDGVHEKMWDRSPIKYASFAKTPTLFIHGEDDFRCSAEQSLQMLAALIYHGVEARAVIFKGENHSLAFKGKPKNMLRRLKEILSWYEKHLKGGRHE